ncbi:unnamed protein product [Paramecium primaurelia]|uniref:Uncharacterized protein n=1 Tax=Paramecium primaurelia TaxID=5886 RepID=A0A8S1Q203_PARPR|nr:unnamed protein product [Paramecium primaurelia]
MIKTRTKPVCKTHFNLSSKQISKYRKYILNLVNRKWLKQTDDVSTDKCKIKFIENKIHHFVPTDTIIQKVIKFDCYPKKGILKTK